MRRSSTQSPVVTCNSASHLHHRAVVHAVPALLLVACATAGPPRAPGYLRVTTPVAAELYVDERFAGATGRELAVYPGEHRIEVRADGMFPSYREVTLAPGERKSLAVPLRPDLDHAAPAAPRATP